MKSLLPTVQEKIKAEYAGISYGMKSAFLIRRAGEYGVSVKYLERLVSGELLPERTKEKRSVENINNQNREWARIISEVKKRPPEEAGELSTKQALLIAVMNGLLPEEAMEVNRRTYDRLMAELGLSKTVKPVVRFQAEYANLAHHFDASSSKFLYVAKFDNGEPILKLFRPAKYYKNKPTPVRARPWIYGVVDDYSGKLVCRYTVELGESMNSSIEFLINHGWCELGLPEKLMADQGMLKKGLASQDLMARLDIEFPDSKPYAKEAHGKIERPWRTHWRTFELSFFAVNNWEKFEITLTELNRQLENYLKEYNNGAHRYEKDRSREVAWHESIRERGGLLQLPENALNTVCRRVKRKIGADGTLNYENAQYTVKGCCDEWVYVFEGIFENKLIVQSIRTGERFEVSALRVLSFGEYSAQADTAHQKAFKASRTLDIPETLYGKHEEEKVVRVPFKKRRREIDNPLDTSCYATAKAAMSDFRMMTSTISLTNEMISELHKAFIENKLSKRYVRSVADELITHMKEKIG